MTPKEIFLCSKSKIKLCIVFNQNYIAIRTKFSILNEQNNKLKRSKQNAEEKKT